MGAFMAVISLILAFNVPENPEAGNEALIGRSAYCVTET